MLKTTAKERKKLEDLNARWSERHVRQKWQPRNRQERRARISGFRRAQRRGGRHAPPGEHKPCGPKCIGESAAFAMQRKQRADYLTRVLGFPPMIDPVIDPAALTVHLP